MPNPKLGLTAKVAPMKPEAITNICGAASNTIKSDAIPSTSRTAYIIPNRNGIDEKADNKKNENVLEKRKREEKLKLLAEKEARKVNYTTFKKNQNNIHSIESANSRNCLFITHFCVT